MATEKEAEEFINILSLSIELCLELSDLLPDADVCNQFREIFYDQALFMQLYQKGEESIEQEVNFMILRYAAMIDEVKKIKNAKA